MPRLAGKIAWITGAGSGIGEAAALALAEEGATTVLTGVATVGDHMASIVTSGWVYGVEGNVTWVDQDGVTHYGGWPACLGGPGNTVRVTFGEVPVTAPDGTMTRQVTWVGCPS